MNTTLEGRLYAEIIQGGIKNLELHRNILNELNVFPVPDGDTGTNMVMTLRYGYEAIKDKSGDLSEIASRFATSAVYGARGNSGVITSQFFRGIADALRGAASADCSLFADAIKKGCDYAYASVSKPVEGTMLTVLRDASEKLVSMNGTNDLTDLFRELLEEARASLQRTPELLPILKKAGVVDSGGSGIVYFFEGAQKVLLGQPIEKEIEVEKSDYVDLTRFDKNTSFDYGYCCEGLLQLKINEADFSIEKFKEKLLLFGESVVASLEGDKVKIHVHTKRPGSFFDLVQKFGELLTVKIENMTVQNVSKKPELKEEKFLFSDEREVGEFAVVAVATNSEMQRVFFEMGADVVIMSDIAPSSQDFLDAFKLVKSKNILVFPNSSNSILASMQAGALFKNASVTVLNSRSLAECYSALAIIDFEASISDAVSLANDVISGIYQLSVYRAVRDIQYGTKKISKNDFFSLSGNKLLEIGDALDTVTLNSVKRTLETRECSILTLFYGRGIAKEYIEALSEKIEALDMGVEIAIVPTYETVYDITVIFE